MHGQKKKNSFFDCFRNYFGQLIRVPYYLVSRFLILDVFRIVYFSDN